MIFVAFGIAKSAQSQPDEASALLDLMRAPAPVDQQQDEPEDGGRTLRPRSTQSWTP
jgi:hypothetical protein